MSEQDPGAVRKVVEIAQAMIDSRLGVVEGSRLLAGLRFEVCEEDFDPDFLPFVGIDSETDHLPLGKVREHWDPTALAEKDAELEKAETFDRDTALAACRALLIRFRPNQL